MMKRIVLALAFSAGVLSAAYGQAGVYGQNQVLAGPTSGSGHPAPRALVGADLPNPGASSRGGVQSLTCNSHNWFNALSTGGVLGCAQPTFADISGTIAASQLPAPTASTLGGVKSLAAASHNFLTQIGTDGSVAQAQPSFSDLSGAAGVDANTLNTQIANYTIATTDCGKTIQAGTGSTGQFTITLPAVTGFDGACHISVLNGDTTTLAGKKLSGFPSTMTSSNVLFPGQLVELRIVNGAWTATNPGRWKNPLGQTTWHVDVGGSDSNDCLAAGTTRACATAQAANTRAVYYSDNQGSTPIIAMACGQTHSSPLSMGGIPLGTQLVQLSPDGNCSFNWFTSGNTTPINIGDLAELDINLTYYGSSGGMQCSGNTTNTASRAGCVYMHGPSVVFDMEGTPVWFPSGANDNGIFCDGFCQPIIANGLTQGAGSGNYVIFMSAGGKMTQSGTIQGSSGSSATGVYAIYNNATLIMTTANGAASTWSGGVGTSKVGSSSVFVNNGLTPAGGITVGTSSVSCSSLNPASPC